MAPDKVLSFISQAYQKFSTLQRNGAGHGLINYELYCSGQRYFSLAQQYLKQGGRVESLPQDPDQTRSILAELETKMHITNGEFSKSLVEKAA